MLFHACQTKLSLVFLQYRQQTEWKQLDFYMLPNPKGLQIRFKTGSYLPVICWYNTGSSSEFTWPDKMKGKEKCKCIISSLVSSIGRLHLYSNLLDGFAVCFLVAEAGQIDGRQIYLWHEEAASFTLQGPTGQVWSHHGSNGAPLNVSSPEKHRVDLLRKIL